MAEQQYVALTDIAAPGTAVFGYRRGDQVSQQVVENWKLSVGTDVAEGSSLDDVADSAAPNTRPGDADTHATWAAWAVRQGMDPEEAENAGMEDLQAYGQDPQRPADSATKAAWADYVVSRGGDEAWARASGRSKADLQAWEPQAGDTVAEAATEANQA